MKKLIFDTDIGCDCDDAGALALVHRSMEKGLCNLLAVTLSTTSPYAAGCTDAINKWYDHEVPIGQTQIAPPGENPDEFSKSYGAHIADNYPNDYQNGTKKPEEAVRLLRKTLAANTGDKIIIIVVGSSVNIDGLLRSQPDDISPLEGKTLMKENVEFLSLMGCYFPTPEVPAIYFGDFKMEAETNIFLHIPAAKHLFENSPVPIAVGHYLVGRAILTGAVLIENERKNPVAESYFVHSHGNRESWDPVSAYYAIFGKGDILDDSRRGTVSIDERGVSTFEENAAGNHILIDCPDPARAAARMDEILLGRI